jgi:hypothetical protein
MIQKSSFSQQLWAMVLSQNESLAHLKLTNDSKRKIINLPFQRTAGRVSLALLEWKRKNEVRNRKVQMMLHPLYHHPAKILITYPQ